MRKIAICILLIMLLFPSIVLADNKDLLGGIKQIALENDQLRQIDDDIYIVKGSGTAGALNNYLSFNNELWRILGFYNGHLKIRRAVSIGRYSFDSTGRTIRFKDSTLGVYLNGDYYDNLSADSVDFIDENGAWYVGKVTQSMNASDSYTNAKKTIWNGKVGIVASYEFLYASIGENCENLNFIGNYSCGVIANDWLGVSQGTTQAWTLSPQFYDDAETRGVPLNIISGGYLDYGSSQYSSHDIYPAVYLKDNIKIVSGTGTSSDPYTIDWYQPHVITVEESSQTENYSVDVDDLSQVEYREIVTFRLSPIVGYELSNVSIIDEDGHEVEYQPTNNSGEYTFVMPNTNISIVPLYSKIKSAIKVEDNSHTKNINIETPDVNAVEYEENVIFHIEPEEGYEVEAVEIKASDGNIIEYQKVEDGYKFVMPDKETTISITYKEIEVLGNEEDTNPQTFDNITVYYSIMIISLGLLIILKKVIKN